MDNSFKGRKEMPPKGKNVKSKASRYKDLASLKGAKLVNTLKEIRETLQKATVDAMVPEFDLIVSQLISDVILKNETREVAQLVGCCIVEVYRLNEGIGFSDEVHKCSLELVVRNLRILETPSKSESYQYTFMMFENLCRTPLLKVIISLGDEGKEIAVNLFRTLFAGLDSYSTSPIPQKKKSKRSAKSTRVSSDPSTQLTDDELFVERERVKKVSMEVIIAVLDLFKHIPEPLLDLLLITLLPPAVVADHSPSSSSSSSLSSTSGLTARGVEGEEGEVKLPSRELVEELLIVKKAKLAAPIQQFCTSMMCAEVSRSELSDSRDHVRIMNDKNSDDPTHSIAIPYSHCIKWFIR